MKTQFVLIALLFTGFSANAADIILPCGKRVPAPFNQNSQAADKNIVARACSTTGSQQSRDVQVPAADATRERKNGG